MSYKNNAFPIMPNKVNLTGGDIKGSTAICVEDGSLHIVFAADNSTETINLVAGNAVDLRETSVATIVSGKFHTA